MISQKQIKNLPDAPGVYYFKKGREILYIGKAGSLRSRTQSYFRSDLAETRSAWISKMVNEADKINFKRTDSVLEALILEAAEIKKHQPPYNSREKDDKSFLYVEITNEDFPRVLMTRGRGTYGPFPHPGELREALKIIRKIFPFRDKCVPNSGKACFNAQLGLCPGVCSGAISRAAYRRQIGKIKMLFSGRLASLIKKLEREMLTLAKKEKFEEASAVKKQLFALRHIQDVALLLRPETPFALDGHNGKSKTKGVSGLRLEAYDIAHLSGTNTVGAMAVMENGELNPAAYRKFKLRGAAAQKADDIANLREILERRFNHPEWPFPNLLIVDGGQAQINVAKAVLQKRSLKIPVIGVVKDERHRARLGYSDQIVLLNQEVHRFALAFHRQRRQRVLY